MQNTASHMQPAQHVMRITAGTTNKTQWQFNVMISPTATISRVRAKLLLKAAASYLAKAPYARYLENKTVNINFCTNPDPAFLKDDALGSYDGLSNTVFINCNKLSFWDFADPLIHELLHANSFELIKSGNKNLTRDGIYLYHFSEEEGSWKNTTIEYRALNEGITEYLKVMAGGKEHSCDFKYYPAYKAIETIAKKVGLPTILEAYFKGETHLLPRAIDEMYGEDAFLHLNMLANHTVYYGREKQEELLGFAQYGYSFYGRKYWPENALPPMLITAAQMDGADGIYASCSPEELTGIFTAANNPARHATEFSFTLWADHNARITSRRGKNPYSLTFLQVTGLLLTIIQIERPDLSKSANYGLDFTGCLPLQPDNRLEPRATLLARLTAVSS